MSLAGGVRAQVVPVGRSCREGLGTVTGLSPAPPHCAAAGEAAGLQSCSASRCPFRGDRGRRRAATTSLCLDCPVRKAVGSPCVQTSARPVSSFGVCSSDLG